MRTIEHEGQVYVLKTDMESAIQSRISKLSSRAIQAEEQVQSLQEKLDSQSGKFEAMDNLNKQIQELGEQLQKSESRYSRHMAISEMGFQDEELRDMVEWSYEKATKGMEEAPSLVEWLGAIKQDPSKAPKVLAPHLRKPESASSPSPEVEAVPEPTAAIQEEPPAILPPKTNKGATQAPVKSTDLLRRGAEDFEFYKANRDSIRSAWKNR
jgi:TolA-binding protein